MSNDDDLRQMFEARRIVDRSLVPTFEEVCVEPKAELDRSRDERSGRSTLLRAVVPLAVVAVSILALVAWPNLSPTQDRDPNGPLHASSATPNGLSKLNSACDSLLATIGKLDADNAIPSEPAEMEWPSETDFLLPFNTLALNVSSLQ